MRGMLAGFTDYSHQSFNDMIEDLELWIKTLSSTLGNLDDALRYIKERDYVKLTDDNFMSVYYYTYRFLNTCLEEIRSILVGIKNEVKTSHINRLRIIGHKASELSVELGKVWHSETNTDDYGNPCFQKVETLYGESRDMCNDLFDIGNLASRLEDFLGEGVKSISIIDMRTLLDGIWILESDIKMNQGTAFMLKDVGFVTCSHVLTEGIMAFHSSDVTKRYPVSILKQNKILDLALINISGYESQYNHLELGNSDVIEQMESIYIAGYPNYRLGDSGIINPGIVTGFRNISGIRRILTNAPIVAGNSGGPVLNSSGEVIGVAVTGSDCMETAIETEFHSIVPINAIRLI